MNYSQNIVWVTGRKGNIAHETSLSFERYYYPGILQEIERGAVAITDIHKVYPCSPHPHNQRYLIEAAFCDVVQGHYPGEDSKFEHERLRGEIDIECCIVN